MLWFPCCADCAVCSAGAVLEEGFVADGICGMIADLQAKDKERQGDVMDVDEVRGACCLCLLCVCMMYMWLLVCALCAVGVSVISVDECHLPWPRITDYSHIARHRQTVS